MGAVLIIVQPPLFDEGSGFIERPELVDIQTLVSQPPVKRFNEGVFDGFTGPNEIELDLRPIGQSSNARDWNSVRDPR